MWKWQEEECQIVVDLQKSYLTFHPKGFEVGRKENNFTGVDPRSESNQPKRRRGKEKKNVSRERERSSEKKTFI